ncbi:Bidirectional sugar transporter SWEET [Heracleum sosnowskyi]|uniref:Bidirectional sugar transporter SWEET n=1 Tax=Heracleum sosnowskyi TaxID=360622 RepID=A0AAD8MSB8_9APIA|nr:Bidirectional sugar transporter SWEET [Heracleum sosnowskyi]
MADLSLYVGIIGNITSVLLFLSPVSTFWRIIKHGSTEEYESLPYICTLLNSSLWTYYGLIKPGEILVATVNGFGIIVEAVYVILFLIYAPKPIKAKSAILAGFLNFGFFGTAVLVTQLALEGEARINAIGFLGAGLNIIMYGSPLAAMGTVVRSKSVEYMPFFLSFFIFLNSGVWTLYAFLLRDYFLGVPNGTGVVLGLMQLALYGMYRNSKISKNSSADEIEEGLQHEPLISAST